MGMMAEGAVEKKQPKKIRLTKRNVESIEPPAKGERIVWDDTITGYGVRVSSRARHTYFIHARTRGGRQLKMKIGIHGTITAERAREIAARELGKIAGGDDPVEAKRQAKAAEAQRLAMPTVAQLCDRYLAQHAEVHKRPSSIRDDRAMIETRIKPALGTTRVPDIKKSDVEALHRSMKATPYRANRTLALLSKMFSLAVSWELRSNNPAKLVKRYSEIPRARYLSDDELGRLATALAGHPSKIAANAVRLLLLTGARRGEVLSMTWAQIDQESGVWVKAAATTKQEKEHRVPLSPSALAIIEEMREGRKPGGDLVFPGRAPGERVELKRAWRAISAAAGIDGARVHDLRHTFASLLVGRGVSLPLIGALLGHTQAQTTQRYAHVDNNPQRVATTMVAERLAAIGAKAPAEVVPLPARRV
jgi:integrase